MIRNFFKIALRNLSRHKLFSGINILGLSIGIATCVIIMLFVRDELSYDRFDKKADRIVRVVFRGVVQGERMNEAHVMPPVAQTLRQDYPQVQEATRLRVGGSPRISYREKSFREDALAFADSNFFAVFTLPFVKGDPKTALLEPNSLVISRKAALKYFGAEEPLGKTMVFNDSHSSYTVTGVIENVPTNSHFHFDLFASMASLPEAREASWMRSEFFTYLVLQPGYDYKKLEAKMPQVVEKYMGPQMQEAMGISFTDFRKSGNSVGLYLQRLTDIHLHSDFNYDLGPRGDVKTVYIFIAIAMFMLIIACINFMNLSTAGASRRAREVGIRKVLGSEKIQLVKQFLSESMLLTTIALALALLLVKMALPYFNQLSGHELQLSLVSDPWLLPALLLTGILTGLLAGSYPAFFLASFQPVSVLKGKFIAGKKSIGLRSGLVIFQFFISVILIIGTAIVYLQLQYIQNKKLGYDKDQVLILRETGLLGQKEAIFRHQLLQDSRISHVATSGYLPAGPTDNNNFFVFPGGSASQQVKTLRYDVDDQYIPALGVQLIAGRNFSDQFTTDSNSVIINEAAVKAFGWGKSALGKTLTSSGGQGAGTHYRVIGVVKDFHFRSLHERISPLVMVLGKSNGLIVKFKTRDVASLLTSIKKQWSELTTNEPFTYSFLDERLVETYASERKIGRILAVFAGLTIFVACMGLFGLATFIGEQRTKEIGIRKVMGASVPSIVALLSKDFVKLVLLANALAWPLAWWAMNKWLQDFAYRIGISWWVFVLAGGLAVLIALLTIGFQAIRAALANPIKSLRAE